MNKQNNSLWKDRDFFKLWFGQTVSLFGGEIITFAIPLVAVLTLDASPEEMGYLNAFQFLPFLFFTLFTGVWIDKKRRKPILIISNLGKAITLSLIPISFMFNFLNMTLLYIVIFLLGIFIVFFDLAYQSYLPTLVEQSQVLEGNSKLEMSASFSQVSGDGVGGLLVSIFTAPIVILFGTISYLISAFSMSTIQKEEPKIKINSQEKYHYFKDIKDGIVFVFKNPYLRAICGEAATFNFFNQIIDSVLILYLTNELNIPPNILGLLLATSSIGALIGSLLSDYIGEKVSVGKAILGTMIIACMVPLLIPIASNSIYIAISLIIVSFFTSGFAVVISNIYVISLRQTVTPKKLLGKMNASYRFIVTGAAPIGALLGGQLGAVFGLRSTLFIGAFGTILALLWVIFSPLPTLKKFQKIEQK